MKLWKIWKFIINHILTLLLIDGIVVFLGGLVYFDEIISIPVRIGMSLQNVFESLLFNPFLSISDLISNTDWQAIALPRQVVLIIYALAMIITPLLDLLIAFRIVDHFVHFSAGIALREEKRVLLIGSGEDVLRILKKDLSGFKIYLWSSETLSDEEKSELYEKRVAIYRTNNPFVTGESDSEATKAEISKFLLKKKIEDIILLETSDVLNMQCYMMLSSLPVCRTRTIRFYQSCYDPEIKHMSEDYFNAALNAVRKPGQDTHMDLRIFNILQIQAIQLFRRLPLYTHLADEAEQNRDGNQNIHLLIQGGGQFGEALIVHAMNQAVLSVENEILIDVIDRDVSDLQSRLKKRFQSGYVAFRENEEGAGEFYLDQTATNGSLKIRLWETDVNSEEYEERIRQIRSDEITYVIVTIPDPEVNIHCLSKLNTLLKGQSCPVPIVLRISRLENFSDFIKSTMADVFSEVYLFGDGKDLVSVRDIINQEEEERIRRYHARYNLINDGMIDYGSGTSDVHNLPDQAERDRNWNALEYYKRDANRALYYHDMVKQWLWEGCDLTAEIKSLTDQAENSTDRALSAELARKDASDAGQSVHPELLRWAKMEHRRWCYFLASDGWDYDTAKIISERKHNCLYDWESLKNNPETNHTLIYDLLSCPAFQRGREQI